MLVGTSGYIYVVAFWVRNPPIVDRWLGCQPIGLEVKREVSKNRELSYLRTFFNHWLEN